MLGLTSFFSLYLHAYLSLVIGIFPLLILAVLMLQVNASGQFCGVAEMIGPVDFENDADYWQQDRWSGQFPVKWHIIKDVPNSRFRHILLENNDNKPVTHSRDSQEVLLYITFSASKCFIMFQDIGN